MYMAKGVDDLTIQYLLWGPDPYNPTKDKFLWWPDTDDPTHFKNGRANWSGTNTGAYKFSFTLYDSRGVIEDGKRFSYIVYVGL